MFKCFDFNIVSKSLTLIVSLFLICTNEPPGWVCLKETFKWSVHAKAQGVCNLREYYLYALRKQRTWLGQTLLPSCPKQSSFTQNEFAFIITSRWPRRGQTWRTGQGPWARDLIVRSPRSPCSAFLPVADLVEWLLNRPGSGLSVGSCQEGKKLRVYIWVSDRLNRGVALETADKTQTGFPLLFSPRHRSRSYHNTDYWEASHLY